MGTAEANINRRAVTSDGRVVLGENPNGPVDQQLGLLRLERPDGSLIGMIANYAIHGTVLGGGNKLISGDIQGIISEYVEKLAGAPMLFVNGAEGNIGPRYSIGSDFNHPHWDAYNKLLGDRILGVNESIHTTSDQIRLAIGKAVVETPRRSGLGWLDELSEYSHTTETGTNMVRIPIYSLSINNDTVVWAAPLELFCEVAINIRNQSPYANTFYFGLTNGSLLYMPTKRAFAEAGYEVGTSPFTEKAENDLTQTVIQHIKTLHHDQNQDS